MTWRDYTNKQIGFVAHQEEREQMAWNRARWVACVVINPHIKRNIKPIDICRFPWDNKKAKGATISKEDYTQLQAEAAYMDKVHKKFKTLKEK